MAWAKPVSRNLIRVCGLDSSLSWIPVRLCGLLWFKRFLNHERPQSYTEGFDVWFELPQPDPGEGSYWIARWSKTPGSGAIASISKRR